MDIDNLIERLMSLKYRSHKSDFEFNVISEEHRDKVIAEIMSWYKNQNISNEIIEYKRKIAELEAKVYTYENIIANSNFAPILPNWVDYTITCNEKGKL